MMRAYAGFSFFVATTISAAPEPGWVAGAEVLAGGSIVFEESHEITPTPAEMHVVYPCQSSEQPNVIPNYTDDRVCMETLHAIFSLALFLDPAANVTVHVLANEKCRRCIGEERALGHFGASAENVVVLLRDMDDVVSDAKSALWERVPEAADVFFSNFKPTAAAKILFPVIQTFSALSKLVVLDADTFFCDDVSKLWQQFGNFKADQQVGLAAEQDIFYERGWYAKGCLAGEPGYEECPPFPAPSGLNSGVALLQLDRLRQATFAQQVADIVADYGRRLKLADQDVWNVYAHLHPKRIHELPCEWNVRTDSRCQRRNATALMHGNRWTLHHTRRPFAKAWMKLGVAKNATRDSWGLLRDQVQKLCRREDFHNEPWP